MPCDRQVKPIKLEKVACKRCGSSDCCIDNVLKHVHCASCGFLWSENLIATESSCLDTSKSHLVQPKEVTCQLCGSNNCENDVRDFLFCTECGCVQTKSEDIFVAPGYYVTTPEQSNEVLCKGCGSNDCEDIGEQGVVFCKKCGLATSVQTISTVKSRLEQVSRIAAAARDKYAKGGY